MLLELLAASAEVLPMTVLDLEMSLPHLRGTGGSDHARIRHQSQRA